MASETLQGTLKSGTGSTQHVRHKSGSETVHVWHCVKHTTMLYL
jgi:hypothetical protein